MHPTGNFIAALRRWRAASLPAAAAIGPDATPAVTERATANRLNRLTEAHAILAKSSLVVVFQRASSLYLAKGVQDFDEAHIDGETSWHDAENWIIAKFEVMS
jgi:hypothetical protein